MISNPCSVFYKPWLGLALPLCFSCFPSVIGTQSLLATSQGEQREAPVGSGISSGQFHGWTAQAQVHAAPRSSFVTLGKLLNVSFLQL